MSKRFALIGCNKVASKHAHAVHALVPGASLATVVDVVHERAQALGEKHGGPWFTNHHEMMAKVGDDLDIINILTPSGAHCQNVLDLVPCGKPLVVEKPIADHRPLRVGGDRTGRGAALPPAALPAGVVRWSTQRLGTSRRVLPAAAAPPLWSKPQGLSNFIDERCGKNSFCGPEGPVPFYPHRS
jgi:hypothetical protein